MQSSRRDERGCAVQHLHNNDVGGDDSGDDGGDDEEDKRQF